MVTVLILAAGAAWEPAALAVLDRARGIVVLKRCVDVDDLLASATSGTADAAVLGVDAPGLDAPAVALLRRHGVLPVAVVAAGAAGDGARVRAGRVGIAATLDEHALDTLPAVLAHGDLPGEGAGPGSGPWSGSETGSGTGSGTGAARVADAPGATGSVPGDPYAPAPLPGRAGASTPTAPGRVVTVWGPAGAPGRTTLAAAVAAELARRRVPTLLVDADPYGGAAGQQLGVLDEVSGLLSAARLAVAGDLAGRLPGLVRGLGGPLSLLTGLPRGDRWSEVRPGVLEQVLDQGRAAGFVVVDTGFSLEDDPGSDYAARPGRNQLTLTALDEADEVLVVGAADPVGLTRLARGLVELRERGIEPSQVVVNRMRSTLGWSERDVTSMIGGVLGASPAIRFLPDDRTSVDKALVAGWSLVEAAPDGALTRAIAPIVDALVPDAPPSPLPGGRTRERRVRRVRRVRQRRGGRARQP